MRNSGSYKVLDGYSGGTVRESNPIPYYPPDWRHLLTCNLIVTYILFLLTGKVKGLFL